MAIITKLKEADLLDLQTLFEQSNEESKTDDSFEFVKLPDGIYMVEIKKFEFKTVKKDDVETIKASWTFIVDEAEGEFGGVYQFKSANLKDKAAMTRFLRDVRKFDVEFETFNELLESMADQVIGAPCLIELEQQEDNPDFQWLNIIVEDEEEDE